MGAEGVVWGRGTEGIQRPAWTLTCNRIKSHMPLLPEAKERIPLCGGERGGGRPISCVPRNAGFYLPAVSPSVV